LISETALFGLKNIIGGVCSGKGTERLYGNFGSFFAGRVVNRQGIRANLRAICR
jgi:hypothetical protein